MIWLTYITWCQSYKVCCIICIALFPEWRMLKEILKGISSFDFGFSDFGSVCSCSTIEATSSAWTCNQYKLYINQWTTESKSSPCVVPTNSHWRYKTKENDTNYIKGIHFTYVSISSFLYAVHANVEVVASYKDVAWEPLPLIKLQCESECQREPHQC